ncbi:putative membrane protein [Wickerhamomyces ciferrii]|uniref:Membrane protein n=1 Tax=Wickerhamomyces ciferrii (strain ATCC 14091 / BCRC 22168 / CBS 111 / JCM 3599 / NBRC 0793 / NRRL Y-1031 F-60-10) TaxID=1206466 RepID=K0KYE5_WICCF|nr:uncharacterized protein BN7_6713 [Wickerhamomyces ciferrii]CCH47102.1 putative membrane protein [Wickerhamomyces ciferrii]
MLNSHIKWLGDFLLKQWFFITLAVFIVIARFAPNFARHGGLIRGEYTFGYGALAIIVLQSGLSLKTKDLMKNMGNWRAHLTVIIISFLITPSIMFGICSGIKACNNKEIDDWILVGLIVTSTCSTTIASNVVATTNANGNVLLAVCEVILGNTLGAFISPALLQMFTSNNTWNFANPASDQSIQHLYGSVMKQLGIGLFIPLVVGQIIQNIFPKQTEWFLKTFKMNKVASFCLILIMFSSFSTAFYQDAFNKVSHISIIFLVFFILGIYIFFSFICFCCARPIIIKWIFPVEPSEKSSRYYNWGYKFFKPFYYSRADTIVLVLCGATKTSAVGASLVTSQYGSHFEFLGTLLVSLVLYNAFQVIISQSFAPLFRKWESHDHDNESLEEFTTSTSSTETMC